MNPLPILRVAELFGVSREVPIGVLGVLKQGVVRELPARLPGRTNRLQDAGCTLGDEHLHLPRGHPGGPRVVGEQGEQVRHRQRAGGRRQQPEEVDRKLGLDSVGQVVDLLAGQLGQTLRRPRTGLSV